MYLAAANSENNLNPSLFSSISFLASNFSNNTGNSTDWSITLPASLEDGDIGIIYTTVDQSRADDPSTHPPTGWTIIGSTVGVGSEYPECWVYAKILTAAESSVSVTITGQVSDSHSTAVIVFRGNVAISSFSTAQDFNSQDGPSSLSALDTDPSGETDAITLCLAYSCGRPLTPQYPTLTSSPTEDGQEASPATGQRISYHIFNGSGHTAIDNSVTDTGRQVGVGFYLNLS